MAYKVARPDDLSKFIEEAVEEYKEEVDKVIETTLPKVGKEAVKELKKKSPRLTGSYAKGWKSKIVKDRLSSKVVVFNKTDYQLTHLLEKGHANRNGGRTEGIPHIKKAEDNATKKAIKYIKEGLS